MSERFADNSLNSRRVEANRTVIGFLANRYTTEVFPAMSSHYKPDDVEMGDFDPDYRPAPKLIEDERTGFDMTGDYHCHTDHGEPQFIFGGRWDDQGNYMIDV